MTDPQNTESEDSKPELNTEYYDEVDEEALRLSRENKSIPDPHSRDLWQSTNIGTDDNGPTVDEVAPVFAQARADALANPVTADEDDDEVKAHTAEAAEAAQAEADRIREQGGHSAATGADAGIYDDAKLEDQVPAENFSAAPESDEEERSAEDAKSDELPEANQTTYHDEVDQRAPEQSGDTTHDDLVSDTAGEQGGLDETSAPDAKPKKK